MNAVAHYFCFFSKDEESASDSEAAKHKKLSFDDKVATVEENHNVKEFQTPTRRGVGFADAEEENEQDVSREQVCHAIYTAISPIPDFA